MDIWGLREELFDIARKVAVTGYHCVVPNFWYRQGRVRFEFRDSKGLMKSFEHIPVETQKQMREQMRVTTDEMAMEDFRSVLRFLETQPVKPGPKGTIGYCLGGRFSLEAAALYPDQFRVSASLHGTALVSDRALSPHRHTAKMRGEIYCGFAEHDDLAPASTRKTLEDAFAVCPDVRYRAVLHKAAIHGYALPNRDIHDKQANNRDWENIFAMFKRVLPA
jgi:carboxymethylenebutenolidase